MSKIKEMLNKDPKFVKAVVCFPVYDEKVLLMHRKKTSDGLGQDLVSGIGGKVGDIPGLESETDQEALVRECEEEIGIKPTRYAIAGRVRFIWETKPNWNMDVTVFIVTEWENEPQETAVAKPVWHQIANLPESQMWEDNRHWVPKVLARENVDAVFYYGKNKTIEEIEFM